MTIVVSARIDADAWRIGEVVIDHYGLMVSCDICIYKNEKLWIRMPEFWLGNQSKVRKTWWKDQALSDEMQVFILKKVFDMIELDVPRAIAEKKAYRVAINKKKELTKQENKLTLNEKSSEE